MIHGRIWMEKGEMRNDVIIISKISIYVYTHT